MRDCVIIQRSDPGVVTVTVPDTCWGHFWMALAPMWLLKRWPPDFRVFEIRAASAGVDQAAIDVAMAAFDTGHVGEA